MDSVEVCLFISILFASVLQCSASCYYINSRYYCYNYSYYYYYGYWDSSRTIGAAIGGGISIIVGIVVLVVICRICRARRASQGSVLTNNAIPTVTTQNQSSNMAYYPQNTQQYPYGQPWGQPQWGQQPTGQQPMGQQPFTGYSNTAFSPPPYDQVGYPSKPTEQPPPTAPATQ